MMKAFEKSLLWGFWNLTEIKKKRFTSKSSSANLFTKFNSKSESGKSSRISKLGSLSSFNDIFFETSDFEMSVSQINRFWKVGNSIPLYLKPCHLKFKISGNKNHGDCRTTVNNEKSKTRCFDPKFTQI
jgi:hypothetical protein